MVRLDSGVDELDAKSEYFTHATLAPVRLVDIPIHVKKYSTNVIEKKFEKSSSVFRDWREDTSERLSQSAEHDFQYWKMDKFIKQLDTQEQVSAIITRHIGMLKSIHTYYASKSNYPHMSEPEYMDFLKRVKITDSNVLKGIEFKAATSGLKGIDGIMANHLMRFQFLEIILRLSN